MLDEIYTFFKNLFKKNKTEELFKKTKNDEEYKEREWLKEKELNRILDKIQKRNYESLTKEEKDFLLKMKR